MLGSFVSSKAGHDKGTIYVVIKEDRKYVYLADGKYKTVEKPKRKGKKHIQPIKKFSDDLLKEKLLNNRTIYNEEIKRAIGGIRCQKQM